MCHPFGVIEEYQWVSSRRFPGTQGDDLHNLNIGSHRPNVGSQFGAVKRERTLRDSLTTRAAPQSLPCGNAALRSLTYSSQRRSRIRRI
jgi:hypothetical protein